MLVKGTSLCPGPLSHQFDFQRVHSFLFIKKVTAVSCGDGTPPATGGLPFPAALAASETGSCFSSGPSPLGPMSWAMCFPPASFPIGAERPGPVFP